MPSNPYKAQQKCFSSLRNVLREIPEAGVSKDLLISETLAAHPVSKKAVTEFIDSYISGGLLIERSGILYTKYQEVRHA